MGPQPETSILPLQEWMVNYDSDARPSHLLRCSVALRMHVYIVDRSFGSMFKNGSGRTADLLYAEVLVCSYTRFSEGEEG